MFNVQTSETDLLTLLLPLLLCCMLPTLFRGGQGGQTQQEKSESDSWFVNLGIQQTYDLIVKETDEWRDTAMEKRSKSRFGFLGKKQQEPFMVDQAVSPRLYRVRDTERGEMSFELIAVEEGGTSIKTTYDGRARALIQNFKAKMPVSIPTSSQRTCPSCGKQMMPEFKTCPFCGTKLTP